MSVTVIKEFYHMPSGTRITLEQGWDGDTPSHYSVDVKTGLNLSANHQDHGVIHSQFMNCTQENFKFCAEKFAQLVKPYL